MTDGDVRAARLLTDGPATVEAELEPPQALDGERRWVPFPTEILPPIPRAYVATVAQAIGCDASFPALATLATIAGCIGNRRQLCGAKNSWQEPAVIWGAIVARSGTRKSPALSEVTRSLRASENTIMDAEREALAEHKRDVRRWKSRAPASRGDFPEPPPKGERLIVSDVTVEALVDRLFTSPAGLLLYRDELAGWLNGFDQYKSGKGGDVQAWLEIHRADSVFVDRKSSESLNVPRAAVSIIGSVQPEVLRDALRGDHTVNGLAARLLFVFPPEKPRRWTDGDISAGDRIEFGGLLEELRDLAFASSSNDPVDVPLSPEALDVFKGFVNIHGQRTFEAPTEALNAAFSKIEGYALRLALILTLAREPLAQEVDVMSMGAGIALAEWFNFEAERVYAMFAETSGERDQRKLLDWIASKGGTVTARELQKGMRTYRDPRAAKIALNALAAEWLGEWQKRTPGPSGGRPTFEFRLLESVGVTKTPKTYDVSSNPPGNVPLDADNGALVADGFADTGGGYADAGAEGLKTAAGETSPLSAKPPENKPPGNIALDADNGALAGDVVGSGGFGYADTGGKGSNGGKAATPSAGDAPDSTSPTGDDDAGRQDWEAGFDDWIDEKGELAALRAGDASTADAPGAGKPGKDGGHE